jgi:hypothetical protein
MRCRPPPAETDEVIDDNSAGLVDHRRIAEGTMTYRLRQPVPSPAAAERRHRAMDFRSRGM